MLRIDRIRHLLKRSLLQPQVRTLVHSLQFIYHILRSLQRTTCCAFRDVTGMVSSFEVNPDNVANQCQTPRCAKVRQLYNTLLILNIVCIELVI